MSIIEILDESRFSGVCSEIKMPNSSEELIEIFRQEDRETQFTISGARTGIVGGAVPEGGILISTEKLKKIDKAVDDEITVDAGVTLKELKMALAKEKKYYFAPNPTEETATMAGLFACNGAGGNSRKYGTVGDNTLAIDFVTTTGLFWQIKRGEYIFGESGCNLPGGLRLDCSVYEKKTIVSALTPLIGMDLIDFLAGSEGVLGVVTSLTLKLEEKKNQWGILYFFEETEEALNYIEYLKTWDSSHEGIIEECEYLCENTLRLLTEKKYTIQNLSNFPPFPKNSKAALMVILSGDDEEVLENVLMEHVETFLELGGRDELTWGFEGALEIEKLHTLRHGVPELINSEIDLIRQTRKDSIKIGTDFIGSLTIRQYLQDLKEDHLKGFVFGHALDEHLHINILVSSNVGQSLAKSRVYEWASVIASSHGMVVSEHGVGKIKVKLVESFLTKERLLNMRKIKAFFDPHHQLAQGTILA